MPKNPFDQYDKDLADYKKARENEAEQLKQQAIAKEKAERANNQAQEQAAEVADNSASKDYWDNKIDEAWDNFWAENTKLTRGLAGHDTYLSIVFRMLEWSDALAESLHSSMGSRGLLPNQLIWFAMEKGLWGAGAALGGIGGLGQKMKDFLQGNPGQATLNLPEKVLNSAHVNKDGQLEFDPLEEGIIDEQAKQVMQNFGELRTKLYQGFLAKNGYKPDNDGKYTNKKRDVLTDRHFNDLKDHEHNGFQAYVHKQFKMQVERSESPDNKLDPAEERNNLRL